MGHGAQSQEGRKQGHDGLGVGHSRWRGVCCCVVNCLRLHLLVSTLRRLEYVVVGVRVWGDLCVKLEGACPKLWASRKSRQACPVLPRHHHLRTALNVARPIVSCFIKPGGNPATVFLRSCASCALACRIDLACLTRTIPTTALPPELAHYFTQETTGCSTVRPINSAAAHAARDYDDCDPCASTANKLSCQRMDIRSSAFVLTCLVSQVADHRFDVP